MANTSHKSLAPKTGGEGASAPQSKTRPAGLASLWQRHHLALAVIFNATFLLAGWLSRRWGGPDAFVVSAFVAAYIAGGYFSLKDGLETLVEEKRIDVDLLMVMAAVGAAFIGEWLEGGILLFLFALSNALQFYTMDRTKRAITALMAVRPQEAMLKADDGTLTVVPVEQLAVGDTIVVRPGELVPIDGTIVAGASSLDEASITGESMPVDKETGDGVFGGTMNQNGVLEITVTQLAEDTVIAKVIRMVEEAQSEQSPLQRKIDTIEQYYALVVIGLTVLTAVIPIALGHPPSGAIYRAITLMVVASPCALAMAVPAPVVSAIANGARSGILYKGGMHLENMGRIEVIAFDKTGTLTEGQPMVTDIVPLANWQHDDVLTLAAAVENHSEHPIANAILQHAAAVGVPVGEARDTQALPGRGIEAVVGGVSTWVGNRRLATERLGDIAPDVADRVEALEAEAKTVMFIGQDRQLMGLAAVADRLRPGVAGMIDELKAQGVNRIVMLTGDNERVAQSIARQIGIDEVYSELLPEHKAGIVDQLKAKYGPVAMVGDGVNDAPALAQATVGMAMGAAGTDVALQTADVVLMSNDLRKINHAVSLGRRAQRIIWQNVAFALGVIAVLVAIVLTKGLVLALGVIGHEGSTVVVIFNGLRLLFRQHRQPGEQHPVPVASH